MKADIFERIRKAAVEKRPAALMTELASGDQLLIYPDGEFGALAADDGLLAAGRAALRADRSETIAHDGRDYFIHVFNPPYRLLIVGAVHIAQPLAQMAALAGYAVTVIDPRRAFATAERFPGVAVVAEWPDDALGQLAPDARSAVVTLTHDPKIDDPALNAGLKSDAFYIGALGSRKTHAARLKRLQKQGFNEADMARIHGPVGLAIGARSPAEIAVSVLAQVTQILHQREKANA